MNKSQAIREMLNEKKVKHGYFLDTEYVYFDDDFLSSEGERIDINNPPSDGWEFYNEPEKVELPEGFMDSNIHNLKHVGKTEIRMLMVEINQIIRYLKSKE